MTPPNDHTLALADRLQRRLAGGRLTPTFAKLYSQHVRLGAHQPGLAGWGEHEATQRLDDAVRLLEAGFVLRAARHGDWQASMRRAAELLEWLAHPEMNPNGLPIRLLAAAAYQVAGYPARSSGLLDDASDAAESRILRAFLKGELKGLLSHLARYWATAVSRPSGAVDLSDEEIDGVSDWLHRRIVDDTASSLGVL